MRSSASLSQTSVHVISQVPANAAFGLGAVTPASCPRARSPSSGSRRSSPGGYLLRAGLQPRAVFLDNRMPRLDGAGVLAAMREDPALTSIPVVWMSGDRQQPPSVAAHLEKPFDMDELVAVLRSL